MFLLSKTESDQKVWKSAARRPTGYPKSVGLQKNTLGKALQWLKRLWCCSVEVVFRCNLVPLCEDNTGFVFTPNSVKPLLPGCIGNNFRRTIKGAHSWEPIGSIWVSLQLTKLRRDAHAKWRKVPSTTRVRPRTAAPLLLKRDAKMPRSGTLAFAV